VHLSPHEQCVASVCSHLPAYQVSFGRHCFSLTKHYSDAPVGWELRVYVTDRLIELLVDWIRPHVRKSRVAPDVLKVLGCYVAAASVFVHDILVLRSAELDDDVPYDLGKPRIAKQR
jgi:hypothetical protein